MTEKNDLIGELLKAGDKRWYGRCNCGWWVGSSPTAVGAERALQRHQGLPYHWKPYGFPLPMNPGRALERQPAVARRFLRDSDRTAYLAQ